MAIQIRLHPSKWAAVKKYRPKRELFIKMIFLSLTAAKPAPKPTTAVVLLNRRLIKMSKVITRNGRQHFEVGDHYTTLKGLIAFIIGRK